MYHLARRQRVPRPRHEVFAFFADAANLEKLTPPFLGFNILTPMPVVMGVGARIDYKISLHGIKMTWKTVIESYDPDDRFVDVQLAGPYKWWHHTHTFVDVPGGTEIGDDVDYEVGFGPFGKLAHGLFVKRQLETIFAYRVKVMSEMFGTMSPD